MLSRIARVTLVVALAGIGALALAGCVGAPEPTPTPTTATEPSAEPSTPAEPEIDLEGSAKDNLAYFDQVADDLLDGGGTPDGRAWVDALAAAGYPKGDMEVTPDRTAINGVADNIQFAVRLNGTCLIGQYGNIGYASTTAQLLSTGRCLVGATRPIDW